MPPIAAAERGVPIVHAFHYGLRELASASTRSVNSMPTQPPRGYFETLLRELDGDERLGIVSGRCTKRSKPSGSLATDGRNVWGAARLYRSACLQASSAGAADGLGRGGRRRGECTRLDDSHPSRARLQASQTRSRAWRHALDGMGSAGTRSRYVGYRPSYIVLRALFRAAREPASLGMSPDTSRRDPAAPALLEAGRHRLGSRAAASTSRRAQGARGPRDGLNALPSRTATDRGPPGRTSLTPRG